MEQANIDAAIARYVADGWDVVSRSESEIILARRPGFARYAARWLVIGPLALLAKPRGEVMRLRITSGRIVAEPVYERPPVTTFEVVVGAMIVGFVAWLMARLAAGG